MNIISKPLLYINRITLTCFFHRRRNKTLKRVSDTATEDKMPDFAAAQVLWKTKE